MPEEQQKTENTQQIERDPDLAVQNNSKGVEADELGQYELAEHFYRAACACDPGHPFAAGNVLASLKDQNKLDAALALAEAEFENNKKNFWFLFVFANLLFEKEDYKKALSLCKNCNEIGFDSETEDVFTTLYGACLLKNKKPHEAEEQLKKANERKESGENYDWLIECCEEAGTFAANKSYMNEKLLMGREDSRLPLSVRRYWLAEFYTSWAETIKDTDPEQAKTYLHFAKQYAGEAAEFAQRDSSTEEDNKGLSNANELFDEIEKEISHLEDGFEPPEGYVPSES